MKNNICEVCQTENEPQYKYCKNCGHPLNNSENNTYQYTNPHDGQSPFSKEMHINEFDGVSAEEMAIFVGKNSNKILPKFEKMEITKSKTSWVWPAAILGFILGPLGSALWFFYRKMYKVAMIFFAIGAFVTLLTGTLAYGSGQTVPQSAVESFLSGDINKAIDEIAASEESMSATQKMLGNLSVVIEDVACVASGILAGLFGMYFYKKFCTEKITEYRISSPDTAFYKMGLSYVGGTSGGMLAVGIILMFAVENIADFVMMFFNLI